MGLSRQLVSSAQPLPGPSAWKWSPPVTLGHHSTPPCRSGYGAVLEQSSCSASLAGAGCWSVSSAEAAGSPLGTAWLPFPANPHADTGRTSRLTHPAPACSPESAVTGRQRHPGHRRSQQDGASAAQGGGGHLTPACGSQRIRSTPRGCTALPVWPQGWVSPKKACNKRFPAVISAGH